MQPEQLEKRIVLSMSVLVFTLLLIPPIHEFIHETNCLGNGGNVAEVNYWNHVICTGNVAKRNINQLNFVDSINDSLTLVVFYPIIFIAVGLITGDSLRFLGKYVKKGRTQQDFQ